MRLAIGNYDGSIVARPRQLARPDWVDELQSILTQPDLFLDRCEPGSFHSLTPCAAHVPGTPAPLDVFLHYYNYERAHLSLGGQTPVGRREAVFDEHRV